MNPNDIGKAYDQITHIWENGTFDRSNGIAQHERAIGFVKDRGKALDVGCGSTGRFIDLLQNEKFSPEGVDISKEMISLARQRHPQVRFYQQDICEWDVLEKYDFISAWDSIWHIPLNQQKVVLTKLISSLNSHGVLIFSFGGVHEEGFHTDDAMGPQVYYSSLGTSGFLKLFLNLDCICRHLEYDSYPDMHTHLIVQKT